VGEGLTLQGSRWYLGISLATVSGCKGFQQSAIELQYGASSGGNGFGHVLRVSQSNEEAKFFFWW
jgi:hypothetical protein